MGVHFGKFLHTYTGRIIMSILLWFCLASLFKSACKNNNCLVFHAAPLDDFKDKIYKKDDKCIKYNPVATKCNSNKKTVNFE